MKIYIEKYGKDGYNEIVTNIKQRKTTTTNKNKGEEWLNEQRSSVKDGKHR